MEPHRYWLLSTGLATCLCCNALADEPSAPALLDRIVVSATKLAAREATGSVHLIDAAQLEEHASGDINRVLRQVPGLNIVEEDGFGIRPNIGIRGSGTDRNAKIAVLEDGVPIAPAPYAAPSAYYFPRIARMSAVEVSKGPAAIKYGPQTVAGAIGLSSAPIPGAPGAGPGGRLDLYSGEYGTLRGRAQAGGWIELGGARDLGFSVETLQEKSDGFKRLDSGGDTGFRIEDYVAKLALRSIGSEGRGQSLELKLQHSTEDSDETYLGLTRDDFRASPYRRYRASQLDQIGVTHALGQLTHRIDFSERIDLTTMAYHTQTERAWYKLNDVRNAANTAYQSLTNILGNPAAYPVEYAALIGEPGSASAAGALRVRNNQREYYAAGLQSVLGLRFVTGGLDHELELSARWHRDEEDRFQHDDRYQMLDGVMVLSAAGVPGSQDNRVGEAKAWAFYVRDTIRAGGWTLTPGLRYETIALTQLNWGTTDPTRSGNPVPARSTVEAFMPGLGVTRAIGESLQLVAGLHRGFVSPAPGSTVDPEQSWNYELGLRHDGIRADFEAMAFLVDYENLIGSCTASTGGGCTIGDQYDAGKVRVHGLEFTAQYDAGLALGLPVSIPLSASYTWTEGEFRTSFASDFSEWGNVTRGDALPYVPGHQLTIGAGVVGSAWRLHLMASYVSAARARAGSGAIPLGERVDARTLLDLSGEFDLTPAMSLFASVQNLGNEVYNVALRPAGWRPGAPRTMLAGVRLRF
ncbi:MAG: TonB-dependent receptor [Gammaproteobacteria bacterium]|nr:MAG: TonB-dependent receptor [Gammaproteobacteria bacterium]